MSKRGGIQPGTTVWDEDSIILDKSIRKARDKFMKSLKKLKCVKTFSKSLKIKLMGDDCFAFQPDGGAWFKDDKLVVAFEGKKQNDAGNANQRWWDNASTAYHLNKDIIYVTFCSGKACGQDKAFHKMMRKAHILYGKNFIFFLSENGFTKEEIEQKMKEVLESVE
jgi:hypothetical protein